MATTKIPQACDGRGTPILKINNHRASKFCTPESYYKGRTRKVEDRFWEKVNKTETCWIWTASKSPNG